LVLGLALLSVTHFAFRLSQLLFLDYDQQFAFRPFIALIVINEWILPFALWLAIVWKAVFKASGIHTCPVCGKQVKGLEDHVGAVHGNAALRGFTS
jgi:hypothetical protein